jgi:hypothetical protein
MGLGSGIRKKTYSGSGSRGSKRHRIRIRNTANDLCFGSGLDPNPDLKFKKKFDIDIFGHQDPGSGTGS